MAKDWDAIRTEYVSGTGSIKALAKKHAVSEPGLEKRAGREKWSEARRKMSEQVTATADEKIVAVRGSELAEFNAADLQIAKALRSQIAKHIKAAQTSDKPLDAADLRTLSSASEAAQRIGRLALGASTDNSEHRGSLAVTSVTPQELAAAVESVREKF